MTTTLLVLHIVGAGTWLGANIVQVISTRRLTAVGGATAAAWTATTVMWGRVVYMPASILILATGIGLVLDSTVYKFSDVFVSVGFLAVIISAVLAMVVFAKGGEQASTAFENGDDATGHAAVNRMIPMGMVDTAILLVAIIAMVAKWGAN